MIRVNLLPFKEAAAAEARSQELRLALLVLAGILLGMVAFWFERKSALSSTTTEVGALETELTGLRKQVAEFGDLDKKRKDLDGKLKVISDLGRKRIGPSAVLRDLSKATPDRLWLIELAESGGATTLNGQAVDNQTIADFLRALASSRYFPAVDLAEATQDEGAGTKLKKFLIRATVNYAADPTAEPAPDVPVATP